MVNIFKQRNEVNKLIEERDRLAFQRQSIDDAKNLANSKIEHKIRALENKAWKNQIKASNAIEEINRKLERIERNIISEKEYVNSVSTYKPEDIHDAVKNSFRNNLSTEVLSGRENYKNNTYNPAISPAPNSNLNVKKV